MMKKTFTYSSGEPPVIQGPIWPSYDQGSALSRELIKIKSDNDDTFWERMRTVFATDATTLPLERYKAWASIMSVPLMSNQKHSEYIRLALDAAYDDEIYMNALVDPLIGMNQEDHSRFYNIFSDIQTTMNRVQLLGHLLMTGFTKDKIAGMSSILEIGAGVGDMSDIIYKLGFKGDYKVYDFPELNVFQKYQSDTLGNDVDYIPEIKDLEVDLTIATWSLTEMPMELRNNIMDNVNSKNWLVAYSKDIFGLDNETWMTNEFLDYVSDKQEIEFKEIRFMPWDGGSKYCLIKDRELFKDY